MGGIRFCSGEMNINRVRSAPIAVYDNLKDVQNCMMAHNASKTVTFAPGYRSFEWVGGVESGEDEGGEDEGVESAGEDVGVESAGEDVGVESGEDVGVESGEDRAGEEGGVGEDGGMESAGEDAGGRLMSCNGFGTAIISIIIKLYTHTLYNKNYYLHGLIIY